MCFKIIIKSNSRQRGAQVADKKLLELKNLQLRRGGKSEKGNSKKRLNHIEAVAKDQ